MLPNERTTDRRRSGYPRPTRCAVSSRADPSRRPRSLRPPRRLHSPRWSFCGARHQHRRRSCGVRHRHRRRSCGTRHRHRRRSCAGGVQRCCRPASSEGSRAPAASGGHEWHRASPASSIATPSFSGAAAAQHQLHEGASLRAVQRALLWPCPLSRLRTLALTAPEALKLEASLRWLHGSVWQEADLPQISHKALRLRRHCLMKAAGIGHEKHPRLLHEHACLLAGPWRLTYR